MIAGEEGNNPIGFAQFLGAKHDSLVSIQTHLPIVYRHADDHGAAPRVCAQNFRYGLG